MSNHFNNRSKGDQQKVIWL